MVVVKIARVRSLISGAFVQLLFTVQSSDGKTSRECHAIVPKLHAPGVGDLAVFVSNRERRPEWMKSPLIVFHGRGEAMGLRNDGGLFPCAVFENEQWNESRRFALVRRSGMTTDPMFQTWAHEGLDVTDFYMRGVEPA